MKKGICLIIGLLILVCGCGEKTKVIITNGDLLDQLGIDLSRKVSKSILEGNISHWAKNPDGTANFTVIFTKNISFDEAVEIIQKHGGYYRKSTEGIPVTPSNWHNDLIVIIDQGRVLDLANEAEVKWIDEIPSEPEIYQRNSIYYCNSDKDCVLVSVDTCCGFVSVNKNYKDEVEFVPMVCTQVCPQKAVCISNNCEVSGKGCNELTEQECIDSEYCHPMYITVHVEPRQICTVDPYNSSKEYCYFEELDKSFSECFEKK